MYPCGILFLALLLLSVALKANCYGICMTEKHVSQHFTLMVLFSSGLKESVNQIECYFIFFLYKKQNNISVKLVSLSATTFNI